MSPLIVITMSHLVLTMMQASGHEITRTMNLRYCLTLFELLV